MYEPTSLVRMAVPSLVMLGDRLGVEMYLPFGTCMGPDESERVSERASRRVDMMVEF